MHELINKDLTGWRAEVWYEQRFTTNVVGDSKAGGYFTDKDLASADGIGKNFDKSDGTVAEVLILTADGKTGYIIQRNQIKLSDQEIAKIKAITAAKGKLTVSELKLLKDE